MAESPPTPAEKPAGPPAAAASRRLVAIALPFYGVVTLFALGYALFSSQLRALFGEVIPSWVTLGLGLGLGIALVLLVRAGAAGWPPMQRTRRALADVVGPVSWGDACLLGLVSGLSEELLFRGALWTHLGLGGTTFLFGLVHFIPRRALWVYPVFATVVGLVLGLLRDGTGSVWPCVLAHVTVNTLNLPWLAKGAEAAAEPRG